MIIYSDTLTTVDIRACVPMGTYLHTCDVVYTGDSRHHGRKRNNCYDVRLSGSGTSLMWGAKDKAATYDEWGYFIAALFVHDQDAIIGNYKDASHFDAETKGKYPMVAA